MFCIWNWWELTYFNSYLWDLPRKIHTYQMKTKQSKKSLYIQQTAGASWSFIMLMNLPVLKYVEWPMPCMLNTRQATLMQFPSCNLPLMEAVICSFWCRDPCVTKRPLNHFESSRPKTWEALALTAIVAQITRAAPIWALQHNCLFRKQKIPCSANRFRFRPSAYELEIQLRLKGS